MTVTEEARHRLYRWFEDHASTEVANTMMDLLPPVGWADVARQSDIDRLERRIDRLETRMDRFEGRLEAIAAGLQRDMRLQFASIVAANATMAGIVIAVLG